MSPEVASDRIAQGHGGAEPEQDDVQRKAPALRGIANASADPEHVKTGGTEGESGQEV